MKTLMVTDVHPVPVGSVGYIHFRPDTRVMVPVDMRGYNVTKNTRRSAALGIFMSQKVSRRDALKGSATFASMAAVGPAGLGRASLFDICAVPDRCQE